MVELDPVVQVVTCHGGYVVEAAVYDPDENETSTRVHVCLSIDEVLTRVREAMESQDRIPSRLYPELKANAKD